MQATLVVRRRPDDFYVVIASATIEEGPFLEYYGCGPALTASGRTFPVGLEYWPHPEGRRRLCSGVLCGLHMRQ